MRLIRLLPDRAGIKGRMDLQDPFPEGAACVIGSAHEVTAHVPVGMGPEGIAIDEAGRRAFVACSRSNAVVAVGLDSSKVAWRAETCREPIPVVFEPPTGRVFSANARSDTLTVLDGRPGRLLADVPAAATRRDSVTTRGCGAFTAVRPPPAR